MSEQTTARDVELLTYREADRLLGRRRGYTEALVLAGRLRVMDDGGRRFRIPVWVLKEDLGWSPTATAAPAPVDPLTVDFKPGKRTTIPLTIRFLVLRRAGYACAYCGRRPPEVVLQVDHIVAVSKGGRNHPDNLTVACRDCNLGKRAEAAHLEMLG